MIARSMAICMAALYHEKVLILMQVPLVLPVQLVQKNETGMHWKIITRVLDIPKHIDSPISP